MTEETYIKILQEIEQLLNEKGFPGYLFVLGIRDQNNLMVFHHIFKEMNSSDISKILSETQTKINDEFKPKLLTISQTKAEA